ncbi:MAG TPA: hypothetical protein ENI23_00160 [bacterium]|nr:hypothetical protein [bacterium]
MTANASPTSLDLKDSSLSSYYAEGKTFDYICFEKMSVNDMVLVDSNLGSYFSLEHTIIDKMKLLRTCSAYFVLYGGVVIKNSQFYHCEFISPDTGSITAENNKIENSVFYQTTMIDGALEDLQFVNCAFVRTTFKKCIFKNSTFTNCSFSGCRFETGKFKSTHWCTQLFESCNFKPKTCLGQHAGYIAGVLGTIFSCIPVETNIRHNFQSWWMYKCSGVQNIIETTHVIEHSVKTRPQKPEPPRNFRKAHVYYSAGLAT